MGSAAQVTKRGHGALRPLNKVDLFARILHQLGKPVHVNPKAQGRKKTAE